MFACIRQPLELCLWYSLTNILVCVWHSRCKTWHTIYGTALYPLQHYRIHAWRGSFTNTCTCMQQQWHLLLSMLKELSEMRHAEKELYIYMHHTTCMSVSNRYAYGWTVNRKLINATLQHALDSDLCWWCWGGWGGRNRNSSISPCGRLPGTPHVPLSLQSAVLWLGRDGPCTRRFPDHTRQIAQDSLPGCSQHTLPSTTTPAPALTCMGIENRMHTSWYIQVFNHSILWTYYS